MKQNVWRILIVIEWAIVISASFLIDDWEVNAKLGLSNLTFWMGIILGISIGITSINLKKFG